MKIKEIKKKRFTESVDCLDNMSIANFLERNMSFVNSAIDRAKNTLIENLDSPYYIETDDTYKWFLSEIFDKINRYSSKEIFNAYGYFETVGFCCAFYKEFEGYLYISDDEDIADVFCQTIFGDGNEFLVRGGYLIEDCDALKNFISVCEEVYDEDVTPEINQRLIDALE